MAIEKKIDLREMTPAEVEFLNLIKQAYNVCGTQFQLSVEIGKRFKPFSERTVQRWMDGTNSPHKRVRVVIIPVLKRIIAGK